MVEERRGRLSTEFKSRRSNSLNCERRLAARTFWPARIAGLELPVAIGRRRWIGGGLAQVVHAFHSGLGGGLAQILHALGGKLRLFYLPPHSPDRNPDEFVWKHLKADTVGRALIMSFHDFKAKVKSSMLSLQRNPKKSPIFFPKAFPQIGGLNV